MPGNGWDLDEQALLRIRLVEWLFDFDSSNPGRLPNINDFEPDYPDRAAVDRAACSLLADGSSNPIPPRISGKPTLQISGEGSARVERLRALRANPAERERNCERAFIAWLYDQRSRGFEHPAAIDFLQDRRAAFWGDPFTEADVQRATLYLRERGFIKGQASWGHGVYRAP